MKLMKILLKRKEYILRRWLDLILETYPSESVEILKREKNQFANPIRHTIASSTKVIFDELIKENHDPAKLLPVLDSIIKIRAIQDFTPSEAISFVYLLKKVMREELKNAEDKDEIWEEWLSYESKIDHLASLSFDIYTKCREKIYEVKCNELRNNTFRLLQKANRMV